MSQKFVQTKFDMKTGKLWLDPEELKEKCSHNAFALLIPKAEGTTEETNYYKINIECAVNILNQCMEAVKPNPAKTGGQIDIEKTCQGETEYHIHESMMSQMREVVTTLAHLVNTTSWRDGKYHDFDQFEIGRRLERASRMTRRSDE